MLEQAQAVQAARQARKLLIVPVAETPVLVKTISIVAARNVLLQV